MGGVLSGPYQLSCWRWGGGWGATLGQGQRLTGPERRWYGPDGSMEGKRVMWARGWYCWVTLDGWTCTPPSSARWPGSGRTACDARSCFRCLALLFWNQTCDTEEDGQVLDLNRTMKQVQLNQELTRF